MSRIITIDRGGEFTDAEFTALMRRITELHEAGHLTLEDTGTISTLLVFGIWLMTYHPVSAALADASVRAYVEETNAKPENNQ